jgi:hypothetical protein
VDRPGVLGPPWNDAGVDRGHDGALTGLHAGSCCLVGIPMCYIRPHIIFVTQVLGRILGSLCHA